MVEYRCEKESARGITKKDARKGVFICVIATYQTKVSATIRSAS